MSESESIILRVHGAALTIEPKYGCVATSWIVNEQELLALPCARDAFLASVRTGGIPLLYPYANRLRSDRFRAADVDVDLSRELSLKRDSNGLPIHGLLLRWPHWNLTREGEHALTATLDWSAHPWLMHAYPFAHILEVRWELRAAESSTTLTITTTIRACFDQSVPIAFGWHPYFVATDPSNARVEFPATQRANLDSAGLPLLPLELGACQQHSDVAVGGNVDALFRLGTTRSTATMHQAHRSFAIEFGDGYRWMQAFSPTGANFIALEPMTAATSALTDGATPLVTVGASFSAEFTMTA